MTDTDQPPTRYPVLGVGISALTLAGARDLIVGIRGRCLRRYVCLATANGLVTAQSDPELRRAFNESWLTTPDGMPLVWLAPAGVERVYGPDLLLAVAEAGRPVGLRHYFFGGVPGVAEELARRLRERFPGIEIVGLHTPPFRPMREDELGVWRDEIARLQPDVIWVGLGTPKQERFMAEQAPQLQAGVLIGVGAAFDFHSGRRSQAPRWMQRSGLEWLYRLVTEPRRLARRYLLTNPAFIYGVFLERTGLRPPPPSS